MKVLEGFVDDGRAAPLAGVPAIATVVGTGVVVGSTATDANGYWQFDDLPEGEEYFVNVVDIDGNAVVRGPWSGEVRDVWVRDRLSLSGTGVADLPNSGRTLVGGLPLVLDPTPANGLEWGPSGLFSASGGLTQDLADTLYEPLDSAYTKLESDALYMPIDAVVDAYTKAESDLRYEPLDSAYTKAEADALFLTAAEADALFLTPAEGNAAYATSAHNHDATYVQLSGGSVMTGLLGPTSNNTRDLGTTALRWRKLWAVDGEFTNAPTVSGVAVLTATSAGLLYEPLDSAYTKAEDDARFVQLTGGSVMTGLLGPSTHNTRDLGTTGTRWRALYGMTGDLSTSLTVATKPVAISPDGSNIIEWRANGFYAAAGAVSDIWVNTGGDTMTGDLNMTANVLPTVTNTRDLGSTSLRWRKVWAVDGEFTNVPTVGGVALPTSTHTHDAAYVNVGGDTMTGQLLLANGALSAPSYGFSAETNSGFYLTAATGGPTIVNAGTARIAATNAGANIFGTLGVSGLLTASAGLGVTGATTLSSTLSVGSAPTAFLTDATSRVWFNPIKPSQAPLYQGTLPSVIIQSEHTDGMALLNLQGYGMGNYGPYISLYRAKGTAASPTALTNNDYLSSLDMWGYAGGDFRHAVRLHGFVSGTPGATWAPGGLIVQLMNTSGTLTERLKIDSAGLVTLGSLQVNSRPVIMAGCRVYATATQSLTTGVATPLNFAGERYDTDNFHDNVTNNTRCTVPAGLGGKYIMGGVVGWAASATGRRDMSIKLNGTALLIAAVNGIPPDGAAYVSPPLITAYDLAAGDYVEFQALQMSGGPLSTINNGNYCCEFWLQRIG